MADYNSIAKSFVSHYFAMFDQVAARSGLTDLYREYSSISWEGQLYHGPQDIMAALTKPELNVVKTQVTSVDAVPGNSSGVLIVATGNLAIGNGTPSKFSMTFSLQPTPGQPGMHFIEGQIFRLV